MDTHDFIGHVKANDIYINIVEDVEKRFDTSKHERIMKQQKVKIKKNKIRNTYKSAYALS